LFKRQEKEDEEEKKIEILRESLKLQMKNDMMKESVKTFYPEFWFTPKAEHNPISLEN